MADASPLYGILTAEECQMLNEHTRFKLENVMKNICVSCQQNIQLGMYMIFFLLAILC